MLLLLLAAVIMSPQSIEEAGGGRGRGPGVPGDLTVSSAEGGEVGAQTDAGGSAEVGAALCSETGGSPHLLSVKGEGFLRGATEGESPLLQPSLLPRLDQPVVDRVHCLLFFVFLRTGLSPDPDSIAEEGRGGGGQQDGSLS